MQAFKLFYKIVPRKFIGVFIIYTIIFVGLMAFFSKSGFTQEEEAFELSEVKVSVINKDNTTLSNGLESYINDIATPVDIETDNDSIKDALFFRQTEFIVIIPEGFQSNFASSDQHKIQTMSVPDSTSAQYANTIIERYLNTANVYLSADPDMTYDVINENTLNDLSIKTDVTLLDESNNNDLSTLNTFYNFLSYVLLAMLISMVGRIMLIFNNKNIRRRNYCAPISNKRYNYQLIFSNLLLAFCIWVIFVILSFVINDSTFGQDGSYLFIVNSFVLTIVCISISFLVSSFATKNSIDPIANSVSLGLSFLGGSFVSQALLSDFLKTIGIFNPIFWYVKVNDTIASLSSITGSSLEPIFYGIIVQLTFAAAFLSIALVIIKQKRQAN